MNKRKLKRFTISEIVQIMYSTLGSQITKNCICINNMHLYSHTNIHGLLDIFDIDGEVHLVINEDGEVEYESTLAKQKVDWRTM